MFSFHACKGMNKKLRYILAIVLGIVGAVFVWYQITLSHTIFTWFGTSALVAPIAASVLGGFIVGAVSPTHKVSLSTAVGLIVALPMLFYLFRNGFSHHGRNPFIWYWPFYVIPFFGLGGFLGRGVWRSNHE
jgi:inner membrane protein involved in colicin E2 resistance